MITCRLEVSLHAVGRLAIYSQLIELPIVPRRGDFIRLEEDDFRVRVVILTPGDPTPVVEIHETHAVDDRVLGEYWKGLGFELEYEDSDIS